MEYPTKSIVSCTPQGSLILSDNQYGPRTLRLQVIDILRYQPDSTFVRSVPLPLQDVQWVYDLVLSDSTHKVKCPLHPSLNELVITQVLKVPCIVEVSRWTFYPIGEKRYYPKEFFIALLNQVRVMPAEYPTHDLESQKALPWRFCTILQAKIDETTDLRSRAEQEESLDQVLRDLDTRPIVGLRGGYQHFLFDDYGAGGAWNVNTEEDVLLQAQTLESLFLGDGSDAMTLLRDLEDEFTAHVRQKKIAKALQSIEGAENEGAKNRTGSAPRISKSVAKKFLIVRILAKTRPVYYGKKDDALKFPWKFALRVTDLSRVEIHIDFWESLVPALYHTLKPGDLLRISRIVLREVYALGPTSLTSIVDGTPLVPTFEMTYSPSSNNHDSIKIIRGDMADWFEDKIPVASPALTFYELVANHNPQMILDRTNLKELVDSDQKNVLAQKLESVRSLVSWIGPIERRSFFGTVVYSRWVTFVGHLENSPARKEAMMAQIRLGPSVDIPERATVTCMRFSVHYGTIIGITTQYSEIHQWTDAELLNSLASAVLPPIAAKHAQRNSSWPFTLQCKTAKEYADIYGAKLVTSFIRPQTLPEDAESAELASNGVLDTETRTNEAVRGAKGSKKSNKAGNANTISNATETDDRTSKKGGKAKKSGLGDHQSAREHEKENSAPMESVFLWTQQLPTYTRVDRIVACSSVDSFTFLYEGDYDESKMTGVLSAAEKEAIAANGYDSAKRGSGNNTLYAQHLWIAFRAEKTEQEKESEEEEADSQQQRSDLGMRSPAIATRTRHAISSATSNQNKDKQASISEISKKKAKNTQKRAKNRKSAEELIPEETEYFLCVVLPLSPTHLYNGNASQYEINSRNPPLILSQLIRRLNLERKWKIDFSLLVGVTIHKRSQAEVIFTVSNVWTEPRKRIAQENDNDDVEGENNRPREGLSEYQPKQ